MKRTRPRDVPHPAPDPDGLARTHRRRKEASLHGSRSREEDIHKQGRPEPGRFDDRSPKPPAFCALYPVIEPDQDELPEAVFGQYPRSLIRRVLPWLACRRGEILHVCSGSLPPGEGIRVDVRREARPDILADGRRLPLRDGAVAAVMIDPPYTRQYARDLYGVDYPRPSHLLAEAARVVRPCGRIGFVHYLVPMPPPGCHHVKTFGMSTGFGFHMRAVTIFERDQDALPLGAA